MISSISRRSPIRHEIEWNEEGSISPTERYALVNISDMDDLQEYDVIANKNKFGYRNTGVYIYHNHGIHPLSSYPDDYGSLPEWVEVRKEDCGFSYFKDYLIEHNSYVPFQTNQWEIRNSYVDTGTLRPFKFAYTDIEIMTDIYRKSDGATATISTSIRISAPWLGGPVSNITPNGSGSSDKPGEYYESFQYENGEQHKILYKYVGEPSVRELTEPLNTYALKVHIPTYIVEKAEYVVKSMLTKRFRQPETLYLEAYGSCTFEAESSDFPTLWNGQETLGVTIVLALDSQDE